MSTVAPSAPGGVADVHEVRCLEAHSDVLGRDEGLHHPRAVVIAGLEVRLHAAQHPPQDVARQMTTLHRGADEKAAQTHHPMQVCGALRVAPPHPRIARAKTQRRGRESERAQPAMVRADEIAELAADESRGALWMLLSEQRVPYPALRLVLDHHQPQAFDIAHLGRHLDRGRHRRIETAGRGPLRMGAGGRQRNLLLRLQHIERLQASGELGSPAGIDEAELRADLAGEGDAALERTVCHNGRKARLGLGRTKRVENLALEPHGRRLHTSGLPLSSLTCGHRAALGLRSRRTARRRGKRSRLPRSRAR